MKNKNISLSTRIFISMIFLVVIASIMIASITIFQYNEQAEDYHMVRLERKEEAIKSAINYELKRNPIYPLETEYLPLILNEKLNEISDIHNLDVNIYDLNGNLLRSSNAKFTAERSDTKLSKKILESLANMAQHRLVLPRISSEGKKFKSSYSFINDLKMKRIGIMGVPYLQDNSFQEEELKEFLERLALVYILILFIAVFLAYFLSKYITKSIEYVSNKMKQTGLNKTNEKIILKDASLEIYNLVNSYNNMIDQLDDSFAKLAQIERKQAWREMAKQVAHEIKNPLTPMRLTVQSFERRFDPADPNIKEKLHDFSASLIQQIDVMSSIASAFSNFAEMPKANKQNLNVVEEVKLVLDIFHESSIEYYPQNEIINAKLDRVQLSRVITNLITNSLQAIENKVDGRIDVIVSEMTDIVEIKIIDNGKGILMDDFHRIFEPKFTTKSSGMGLGLAMVKNIVETYSGRIDFQSEYNEGTTFIVTFPK